MKKVYRYFVAYTWFGNNHNSGVGSAEIERDVKITSIKDIMDVQDLIMKSSPKFNSAGVTSFQLFEDE